MKKIFVFLIISSLMLSVGCGSKEVPVSEVMTTEPPAKQSIDTFGVVKSNDVRDILIDFPATVEKVHLKEGQEVKKGDVLITLNYDEFKNQIKTKQTELNIAKQELKNNAVEISNLKLELDKLNRDLTKFKGFKENKSDPDLKKLISDLMNTEKVYNNSLDELKSKELLLEKGAISQNEFDNFKTTVDNNEKSVYDINSSIDKININLQKEIDGIKLQIDQKSSLISGFDKREIYENTISSLENEITALSSKLNKSYINQNSIVSDIENAIVYNLGYVKGENIDPNRKILSLMDTKSVIVEANIPEEFIKDVKLGSEVVIIPQADKSKKYTGKVTYMASKAVYQNGETTVLVQTSIDNNDGFLLLNFNVDLEISIKQ